MHKLFIAGAIYMSYLLCQAQFGVYAETTQDASTITKAYEIAEKQLSTTNKNNFQPHILPKEPTLKNFPHPITIDESDETKIAEYYKEVSKAYQHEADKVYKTVLRMHESKSRNNEKIMVKAYRGENNKSPRDLTDDKRFASLITPTHPLKSSKHIPGTIRKDSKIFQEKSYNKAKAQYDELRYKALFYEKMASQFSQ